jgi:regulator of RNase E activity RraA
MHDFTVFARAHTARTARGRIVETGTNVPITVGDILVSPGDYVVADGSAIVFVARAEVERVLAAAEDIVTHERTMADSLLQGTPISQVMGKRYETLLER